MLRPRSSRPLSSDAHAGAVLTSMDKVAPYLGDNAPDAASSKDTLAPRAAGSADAGTFSMVLVIGVVLAGVAIFAGRHA